MAAGGDPEAKHSSVELMARMCTALRGRVSPEGPLYFQRRQLGPIPLSEGWQGWQPNANIAWRSLALNLR